MITAWLNNYLKQASILNSGNSEGLRSHESILKHIITASIGGFNLGTDMSKYEITRDYVLPNMFVHRVTCRGRGCL